MLGWPSKIATAVGVEIKPDTDDDAIVLTHRWRNDCEAIVFQFMCKWCSPDFTLEL